MVKIEIDGFWILIGAVSILSVGILLGAAVEPQIAVEGSLFEDLADGGDNRSGNRSDVSVGKPWTKIDENATHVVWARPKNETHSYIKIKPRSELHFGQENLKEKYD